MVNWLLNTELHDPYYMIETSLSVYLCPNYHNNNNAKTTNNHKTSTTNELLYKQQNKLGFTEERKHISKRASR